MVEAPYEQPADDEFEELLEYLRPTRNFDFTGYKRPSLIRRVQVRMAHVGCETFRDYQDYLEVHAEEFALLFDAILINVTEFFRDPRAWEFLAKEVIPSIVQDKQPDEEIRVWSAGCASGEEAYSLAILLAEILGEEAFQARVKIYATDLDGAALAVARQGSYPQKAMASVPSAYRDRYFDAQNSHQVFRTDLRRSVIFGRHDLVQDAPISRVDLLVCRNTLMYFNAELQGRILNRFHFALNNPGFLFLGKAEMLLTHGNLFTPVEMRHRVFHKRSGDEREGQPQVIVPTFGSRFAGPPSRAARTRELGYEFMPTPTISIDADGLLQAANASARELFGIRARDIGRVFTELEISYRPAELRSRIDQALVEGRPVQLTAAEPAVGGGGQQYYDIHVVPLPDPTGGDIAGVAVTFIDTTRSVELSQQIATSSHEVETAYEELESTNEELETTNEELQSTNEELETTNEELQSTNEELETTNEELQSTNEELETINDELGQRTDQLDVTNAFLQSILASVSVSVIVVDRNLRVLVWNSLSEDLWGLRGDEALGEVLDGLDFGLPTAELQPAVLDCFGGTPKTQSVTVAATNRRGRAITCVVRISPLLDSDGATQGAVLLIEEVQPPTTP